MIRCVLALLGVLGFYWMFVEESRTMHTLIAPWPGQSDPNWHTTTTTLGQPLPWLTWSHSWNDAKGLDSSKRDSLQITNLIIHLFAIGLPGVLFFFLGSRRDVNDLVNSYCNPIYWITGKCRVTNKVESENKPSSGKPFRLSLRRFLILTAIAPPAIYFGIRYRKVQTIIYVTGYVMMVDWDYRKMARDEPKKMAARYQFDYSKDSLSDKIQVNSSNTIDGVHISPNVMFNQGAAFSIQATYWDYKEKLKRVRKQMDAFVERNPDYKVDSATLMVKEYAKSDPSRLWPRQTILDQRFDTYPPVEDDHN
ncbi:MAG: hypothetical protein COA78_36875 [Blastopirellula sp.]|nr:MAG: hypothetical protein COA78_36875 [Blastopirellula sp.]